jgi:hypothetical protein
MSLEPFVQQDRAQVVVAAEADAIHVGICVPCSAPNRTGRSACPPMVRLN